MNELMQNVVLLLTEAYAGPPDPSSTWFIDNQPDCGILGELSHVSAGEASTSVDGSGDPGSTIAAHAEHLRWSLSLANTELRGEDYQGRWSESWNVLQANPEAWDRLRAALRDEFETLLAALQAAPPLSGEMLTGVLALVPHAAFHLGLLRQMIERVRQ